MYTTTDIISVSAYPVPFLHIVSRFQPFDAATVRGDESGTIAVRWWAPAPFQVLWPRDGVSGNYRLNFPLSGILGPLDPFHNQPLGPVYIYPLADVAPFVSFQIFIMREEMRDLIS